jgi:nucleoid-associated protein YgaU
MKNLKYAALTALLLSSMTAGCNNWNPFKKKQAPIEPPIAQVAPINDTFTPDPIRPDPVPQPLVVVTDDPPATSLPVADGTYTIKKKDTLWSIAARHLGNGQRYRDILAANPGLNAKKLPVGKVITLPPK